MLLRRIVESVSNKKWRRLKIAAGLLLLLAVALFVYAVIIEPDQLLRS